MKILIIIFCLICASFALADENTQQTQAKLDSNKSIKNDKPTLSLTEKRKKAEGGVPMQGIGGHAGGSGKLEAAIQNKHGLSQTSNEVPAQMLLRDVEMPTGGNGGSGGGSGGGGK